MTRSHEAGVIVSDVDGVLLDFYAGAQRVLEDMLGRPVVEVDPRPATRHRYGLTMDQYQAMRVAMRTHSHGWANLPTLPGAVEAVHALQAAGAQVVFLSSCGQSLFDLRRANLDRLGLESCRLVCVEDAHDNAKGRVLDQLRPEAFIDDHMKMLAQADGVPERVWVDHGCALELGPSGLPLVLTHRVCRVPSLASWAADFLARLQAQPAARPSLALA